ncbi:hypothetical protein [uncultured Desulfuromonas sp.]|uniref:hypothetical protein n=1 Tax=uncultured Desulfuromonas sp. TaxID=181013 RepID=UPI002617812E|nr:hypothetical protein [uncultured Desulfuromonas sp.]
MNPQDLEIATQLAGAAGLLIFLLPLIGTFLLLLLLLAAWRVAKWTRSTREALDVLNGKFDQLLAAVEQEQAVAPSLTLPPLATMEEAPAAAATGEENFTFEAAPEPVYAEAAPEPTPEENEEGGAEPPPVEDVLPGPEEESAEETPAPPEDAEEAAEEATATATALREESLPAQPWEEAAEEEETEAPAESFQPPPAEPMASRLPDDPRKPGVHLARCEQCGHKLAYKEKMVGKKVRCPSCKEALGLP